MTSSPLRNLSRVDVYVSIVLSSNIEETWSQARDFGHAPYWAQAGQGEFTVKRLKGKAASEVGSGRMFKVGEGRLYEKLTALDDFKHNMRWMLISHPHTLSPFGQASFLNYSSRLRFRTVTNTGQTFGEWKGEFYTEPQYAEEMEVLLSAWYHAGFEGLQVSATGSQKNNSGGQCTDSHPAESVSTIHDPSITNSQSQSGHDPPTFQDARQANAVPHFDMGIHMQNWAARRFAYPREPQTHPIGQTNAPPMPQHLASHPSQANSKRTHLKGPDVSRSDSPPVQRSAPMQGPPISGHPNSVRPRLSRVSKEPPPTSLHPPSYIDPSNEAGSIQTGPLRPDQYLNSPLEHQNASIGAEMLSREMLNPNVVLRNENGSQQIFEQMRPSGLSQSSAHTSKPNMYDGGAFSSLRPISAFNAQSMANPAFTHRVPLSSTERGMLSKPSIETMATSNSNLTASSYPHLSQYASQASLGQPSFYDAESVGHDPPYSQGFQSGLTYSQGASPGPQYEPPLQSGQTHEGNLGNVPNNSSLRKNANSSTQDLQALSEQGGQLKNTTGSYQQEGAKLLGDSEPKQPLSGASNHDLIPEAGFQRTGQGTSSMAPTTLSLDQELRRSNPKLPHVLTKVQPSPFAQSRAPR